jgi:aspartate aminotransferase
MFDALTPRDPDAIMALMEAAKADPNPEKIDLGVGVYKTSDGETPVMRAVSGAQAKWLAEEDTKLYMGTTGSADFRKALLELVLGDDHPDLRGGRIASSQAAGGSGALRIGAELIVQAAPNPKKRASVWGSTPTWANHVPLISSAGLEMKSYPYYDRESLGVDFEAMMATLRAEPKAGDVVLLHGCCHNPTGADLSDAQWAELAAFMAERELLPFIDLAYLGLGRGLSEDAFGLKTCLEVCPEVLFTLSCSKNFALYRERTGLVGLKTASKATTDIAQTHFGAIQRKLISMPPAWGAMVVSTVLHDRELRHEWVEELNEMRTRIRRLRRALADELSVQGGEDVARAVADQQGMFSMLPVSKAQAEKLRAEHSVYITNSGRMNIAAANLDNIPALARALLAVMAA